MDRWKSRGGKSQRREKVRRERVGTKKIKVREKVEKSRNIVFCSKSRLAKEAGAEPSGQMGNEKLHAAPAHFEAKMRKTPQVRNTFGSWHVQKVYAVVAPNTFRTLNVQKTAALEHFWKLRCSKSARPCGAKQISKSKWCSKIARRCGEKQISKSKCANHFSGTLLEVEMFKKCTPLWRKAHFDYKMYKTPQLRNTFGSWDVQKAHAAVARNKFRSQNTKKHHMLDHFWKLRCSKSARRCGAKHISKSKCWTRSDVVSQAQGILNLAKSEQNAKVLWQLQQRWQAWDVWRRSAKMHFACLAGAQGLQFGGSNLKSSGSLRCFLWQAQHFVWPGLTFSRQAQYFRQMSQQKRKTQWYEAVSSALNFPFLKEVWQNGFACAAVKF